MRADNRTDKVNLSSIAENLAKDGIDIEWIDTKEQAADIFTKALVPLKWANALELLGINHHGRYVNTISKEIDSIDDIKAMIKAALQGSKIIDESAATLDRTQRALAETQTDAARARGESVRMRCGAGERIGGRKHRTSIIRQTVSPVRQVLFDGLARTRRNP